MGERQPRRREPSQLGPLGSLAWRARVAFCLFFSFFLIIRYSTSVQCVRDLSGFLFWLTHCAAMAVPVADEKPPVPPWLLHFQRLMESSVAKEAFLCSFVVFGRCLKPCSSSRVDSLSASVGQVHDHSFLSVHGTLGMAT